MAILSHHATGFDALRRRLAAVPAAARTAASSALTDVAEGVATDLRRNLDQAPRLGPAASASGALSAGEAARLSASISVMTDQVRARSSVMVSSPAAPALEFGTLRRAAHPFLRPAALRASNNAKALLALALRRGLA